MTADERPAGQLSPHDALRHGHWVKLICGASNQDLPAIADLCAVYGAAGIDCVIVPNRITESLDFTGAAAVLPTLAGVTIRKLESIKTGNARDSCMS